MDLERGLAMLHWKTLILTVACVVSPTVLATEVAKDDAALAEEATCPASDPSASRTVAYPDFPDGEAAHGTVILILQLDHCGRVVDVRVERSSGSGRLDEAAIAAAASWILTPGNTDRRVRVPIDFAEQPQQAASAADFARLTHEETVALWKRLQVPKVEATADGMVAGYIKDPLPLGFDNVAEARAALAREGKRREEPAPGITTYQLRKGLIDITEWEIYEGDFMFAPSIVRHRLVTDGDKTFWATTARCEARPQALCAKLDEYLAGLPPQKTTPPPPAPPGAGASG